MSILRSRECVLRLQGELTILKSHAASIPSRLAYALWLRVALIPRVTDIWPACLVTEWGRMLEISFPINLFLPVVITWSLFCRTIWRLRRIRQQEWVPLVQAGISPKVSFICVYRLVICWSWMSLLNWDWSQKFSAHIFSVRATPVFLWIRRWWIADRLFWNVFKIHIQG